MRVVSQNEIKEFNRLYLQLGTYTAVARATGFSPSTVKKYIINGYTEVDESTVKKFEGELPDFDPTPFRVDDWGPLCVLTDEEINEIKELWKEMEA